MLELLSKINGFMLRGLLKAMCKDRFVIFGYTNMQSLRHKVDRLSIVFHTDVISVVETWLDDAVDDLFLTSQDTMSSREIEKTVDMAGLWHILMKNCMLRCLRQRLRMRVQ